MSDPHDMDSLANELAVEGRVISSLARPAARDFVPDVYWRALSSRVLAVARTRVEGAWAAYVDAVPGVYHEHEIDPVLLSGSKLDERIARVLFNFEPFKDLPYAR